MKNFTKLAKENNLVTVLLLSLLIIAIIVGVILVRRPQDIREEAAVEGVDLTVSVPGNVEYGQEFDAQLIMDPKGRQVSAADVEVKVDPSMFEIVSIRPGSIFDVNDTPYAPNDLTAVEIKPGERTVVNNDTGVAKITVGAPCDACRIGNSGENYPVCTNNTEPKCYPTTGEPGVIALLTLRAKDKVGASNVDFVATSNASSPHTQAAAIDASVNVLDNLNNDSLNVKVSCEAIDFDNSTRITNADIQQVANKWNTQTGDSGYATTHDFDKNGRILNSDIQQVANNFNINCN